MRPSAIMRRAPRAMEDIPQRFRGQALVETAILLPILLILLLGAIDFGRAFFGWVNLHQAVRIGANFAATHADATFDKDRYDELIEADLDGLNCEAESPLPNPIYTTRDGTPTGTPVLGDYATLTVGCEFSPITPLGRYFFGEPIPMSATATFPIRAGCVNCPTPAPASPPPTPLQCRLIPDMEDMSVAGARLAWASAGFDPDNFVPFSGQDTETVDDATVTEDDPLSTCELPYAIFSSSAFVTTLPEEDPCDDAIVPNLIGMPVGDARAEWVAVGFQEANFTADIDDDVRVVVSQTTDPPSEPGVTCLPLTATIDVVTGDPWPEPPPSPCRVPNMINSKRSDGAAEWVEEGFDLANFSPTSGNFTIKSQSLVGGTWVTCDASVTVAANPS